jgi:beta-glucosidase
MLRAMARIEFPDGFLWGAATAAYQVEGSPLADGACPSNWHRFAHRKGRIADSTTGDVACDHYTRYREDIRAMRELGLKAYRFSIAWPRIVPEPGRLNDRGLDFYKRLVDALLEAGITPLATIFHWDIPAWLEDRGGFARREAVDALVDHGTAVFRGLGDRLKLWITVNEPFEYAGLGYVVGAFPPGRRRDLRSMFHVAHHLLLGHSRLAAAFPGLVPGGRLGITLSQNWITPRRPDSPRDREAAELMDAAYNRAFLDPVILGRYPPLLVDNFARFFPKGFEEEASGLKGLPDFLGINYYQRTRYGYAPFVPFARAREHRDVSAPRSAMWEIYPAGLYRFLLRLRSEYGNPPCMVTENGYPLPDAAGRDPLDDPERIAYLSDHIAVIGKAIAEGVDCRGYFHWTLMDNFEWAYGNTMRFGLLRTDFATQERTWKTSASWYRAVIRENSLTCDRVPETEAS